MEGLWKGGRVNSPVSLIQIDAHADTFMPQSGDGQQLNHGSFARLAFERGLADPQRSVQVGLRTVEGGDADRFAREVGLRQIYQHEFDEIGIAETIAEIRRVTVGGPIYVTVDIDAIDPSVCPGTGYPEPGGFNMREIQTIIRGLRGIELVGADISEVAPPFDQSGTTALNAANILFEILCLAAERLASKQGRI